MLSKAGSAAPRRFKSEVGGLKEEDEEGDKSQSGGRPDTPEIGPVCHAQLHHVHTQVSDGLRLRARDLLCRTK